MSKCLQDALAKLDEKRAWLQSEHMVKACEAAEEVAKQFSGAAHVNDDFVGVDLHAEGKDSFAPPLRIMAKHGFHQRGGCPGYANQGSRWALQLYHEDNDRAIVVLYFSLAGSTCSLVQTGVRTEPVYEIQCDEVPA